MTPRAATFRRLMAADAPRLEAFFAALVADGTPATFHPHPFTPDTAAAICRHADSTPAPCDEYHAGFADGRIVAYGMLRGWVEGYAVPSLGIAVRPDCRGRGVARAFMQHLHGVAADRGATKIRLKVYKTNTSAIGLYESLGYELESFSATELLGHHPLAASLAPTAACTR